MRGRTESGQATVEYVLLLLLVMAMYFLAIHLVRGRNLAGRISEPIKDQFARAYQYGHPKAKGLDEPGGPDHHPRAYDGNNFRLYINPGPR